MGRAYRGETFNSSKETWTSYQDEGDEVMKEDGVGGEGGVVEAVSLLHLMEEWNRRRRKKTKKSLAHYGESMIALETTRPRVNGDDAVKE